MELFIVGFVRSPHGLAGNFKFVSASGEYAHFANIREVTLKGKGREKAYAVEHVELSASYPTMKP
jgi:16S rRNA processing protein RimM